VCYIRRTDRGAALKGVRLIGSHTDDSWQAGDRVDPTLVAQSIHEAAIWIRDRLASGSGSSSKNLDVLCLDADGAVCSWVKPEDADPTLLDATISGGAIHQDLDELDVPTHSGVSERFPNLPMELSYEPLNPDETSTGSRAAMMAVPDIPGRLLKDELDSMGIRIECFTSIWHALASVWDPGSGNPSHSVQRVVSSDAPIAAIIAVDASEGRLIWTWSRQGELITAGTSRVQLIKDEHALVPHIRKEDISRVCSDWLGWSSQLGVSPSRILFIGSSAQVVELDPDSSNDQTSAIKCGLTPGEIGVALSQSWPNATVDLVEHHDPIGETLSKVESGKDITPLTGLTSRPGKVHRSMYRWACMALLAVAATIGIFAYQLFSHADSIKAQTSLIEIDRMSAMNSFDPELVRSMLPLKDLKTRLDQMRSSQGPLSVKEAKPILEELETVSYVFGIPGIELESIRLNNTAVTVIMRVDEINQAEQVYQSLSAINGSHLRWVSMAPKNQGQKIQVTYNARWVDEEGDS